MVGGARVGCVQAAGFDLVALIQDAGRDDFGDAIGRGVYFE